MKPLLPALLLLSLLPALPAQNGPLDPSGAVVPDVRLSREQLKELTGPIALYPDPLVAMILPASTFPSDVVLAARFVQSNEDPARVDEKPWDESVRGLTRYPDVLTWMDENLEWTTQLGYAYLAQPEDVMDSIQELRAQAQTVGNLVDTPQQRVVREETYIRIVPAQPEYIYVPYYDPEIVYYERPYNEPYLTFSAPWLVGAWLTFDFDWHRHRLYCGDWHGDWDYRYRRDRDYRGEPLYINNSFTNYSVWQGDSRRRLGSTRAFAQNRDLLRQSNLATPSYFQERFDVSERERRAVAVSADVRQRDRRNAVGEVTQLDRAPDRTKFGTDGRIRSQDGERATLTKIADRENERLAVEAKKREEIRARLTAEGKISARDPEGKRVGAGGKVGDRNKVGADGRMTERTLPGETIKPAEVPTIGERGRGKASKEGERGKVGPDGRATDRTLVPSEAPKIGDVPKNGERGKGRVTTPPTAAPSVTGELKPDEGQGKGRGKGKDADRGPSGQSEIPKAELPKGRPDVKDMPNVAPGPAPVIPDGTSNRGKRGTKLDSDDKGKGALPGPRTDAPRIDRPSTPKNDDAPRIAPKNDDAPRIAPQSKQDLPKGRPLPPVNVDPPKPKVQTPQAPSVRPAPPEEKKKKKDESAAHKSAPSAPNVVHQAPSPRPSAPKPQVAATPPRPQPQKQVAAAPRPQPQPQKQKQVAAAPRPQPQKPAAVQQPIVKPQALAAPKPQTAGKKPTDEDDKKKKDKK
jgi:hypothetical protein